MIIAIISQLVHYHSKTKEKKELISLFTYQCKRRACKKADNPSNRHKIKTVNGNHTAKAMKIAIDPINELEIFKASPIVISHNTTDNSTSID